MIEHARQRLFRDRARSIGIAAPELPFARLEIDDPHFGTIGGEEIDQGPANFSADIRCVPYHRAPGA